MGSSPLLELAEAYYTVARDLESSAREQLDIACRLNKHADALCEQNIRQTPAPDSASATTKETP